jgi:hypothetical protein
LLAYLQDATDLVPALMTRRIVFFIAILAIGFAASARAFDEPLFHHSDPLAQQDEWGLLTPGPLNPTDFAPRHARFIYYFEGRHSLIKDTAYVGALQTALQRKGAYAGPIDGVFSDDVSFALAKFQKANAMRVTGTLTIPVRRALCLP